MTERAAMARSQPSQSRTSILQHRSYWEPTSIMATLRLSSAKATVCTQGHLFSFGGRLVNCLTKLSTLLALFNLCKKGEWNENKTDQSNTNIYLFIRTQAQAFPLTCRDPLWVRTWRGSLGLESDAAVA